MHTDAPTTPAPRVSQHAITRYIERVDAGASRLEARFAIGRLLALGRARAVPRHWMRRNGIDAQPGLLFVYCAASPGVCVLVRDRTVVTVITRAMCTANRPQHLTAVPSPAQAKAAEEAARRWRWDRIAEMEGAA